MQTTPLDGRSFKVSNFKCFGSDPQGFDELKPINVIIGRNNSGKSALLDLIRHFVTNKYDVDVHLRHAGAEPVFECSLVVSRDLATQAFRNYESSHYYVQSAKEAFLRWGLTGGPSLRILDFVEKKEQGSSFRGMSSDQRNGCAEKLAQAAGNPLAGRAFCRLAAERDILPETDASEHQISSCGQGATNIIQNYLSQASLDRSLVEVQLLEALNTVLEPDATFSRILCRQLGNSGPWEISLDEDRKGLIPLSHSGSGLKTVILVLLSLIVAPKICQRELSQHVFAFEELENNLHPSLLRRLLSFIVAAVARDGFLVFLTTHSSTTIDFFAHDRNAQIVHVRHDGKTATTATVKTYIENCGILDDLDVRASDLLQANCVIWVELVPSDRIYLNRWIELWSDGELKEGNHYQCVFYGGRLLAHLDCGEPTGGGQGVAILRLARHACVVIDSDKRIEDGEIDATKKRIGDEIKGVGGMVWVSKGREIENYLPRSVLAKWKGLALEGNGNPYEDVFDLLEAQQEGLGQRYRRQKPKLAEELVCHMDLATCRNVLDLDERMTALCEQIRKWNGERD